MDVSVSVPEDIFFVGGVGLWVSGGPMASSLCMGKRDIDVFNNINTLSLGFLLTYWVSVSLIPCP